MSTMAHGRPVFEATGVGKTYANGTVALTDVDIDIREGEFVSLVGPSGCGKSTLLRMIAGLGQGTEGEMRWWEQDFGAVGQAGRKLAFVFQEAALMPWATVARNVELPLRLSGQRKNAEQVEEALEMVGLQDFRNAYPRELSGGMQMRVSIARALITKPNLLLMDEPFGALDEMTRAKLNQELLELWERLRWTVVFVTHSVYESVFLSTRVVVMAARPGRVLDDIVIDAPAPRSKEFRASHEYHELCNQVSESLARAAVL
ncbi:nitrate/sulfonate/bicarbonate ABC transporter ATP-binding protein [Acidihalobacter ferrooxydans]|uniref:Nitrate/sulfonate/bicarbonate ABC transporter ATP-binding protein n=2 Tax=Acidihalobacter ferrooxydans TaxID=1765967 RepID=A0A1P8UL89_9GAMM|nr:nitrate/sulfonate/bicarbonate ABC transporter ATP-binding protein [Acidihalobacter ferrooxydans]